MDPLQLLLRSSRRPSSAVRKSQQNLSPSTGPKKTPQLYGASNVTSESGSNGQNRKRKRGSGTISKAEDTVGELDFFGSGSAVKNIVADEDDERESHGKASGPNGAATAEPAEEREKMDDDEIRAILKRHKLKITVLRNAAMEKVSKSKKNKNSKDMSKTSQKGSQQLFPEPVVDFRQLHARFSVSQSLAQNIREQGYKEPTEVQMASLPVLLSTNEHLANSGPDSEAGGLATGMESIDLLTVAPTGSGKTLAFMIPLIQSLVGRRRRKSTVEQVEGPKAIILAPTKELANQIANEGRKLAANTGIRITSVRKGMQLGDTSGVDDEANAEKQPPVKSDILVSTPGTLAHAMEESNGKSSILPSVRFMIMDEADVLLDPLFREQTLTIWNAAVNPALRVSLWSATMGSNIEELATQVIDSRVQKLQADENKVQQGSLIRLVVGLKDSAVPNIDHRMTYAASEQGKLMGLRELLHPRSADATHTVPLRAPFLVFTQTIERAVALHSELLYDIPAEAGGISRIAVLHSDLSDNARDQVMTRFRKGEIWVLITTDLLSRGVDFRGVNGVVNYDIPTSSAAYIHRVGRTGRAGREGGVAVTLYTKEDIPYVKNVANVIAAAQKQTGITGAGQAVPQWLLDSLPDVSKQDKKKLKQRGVEARRSAKPGDKKGKMRISTKSGFERRQENNRKGAVQATKRIRDESDSEDQGAETDFGGFDD